MRRAERTLGNKRDFARQFSGDRKNFSDLEGFRKSERRKDGGKCFREKRFPGSGRSGKKHIMPAGRGDLERALGVFLAFDVDVLFLFPVLLAYGKGYAWLDFVEITIFIGILSLVLVYAWCSGVFSWKRIQVTP